MRCNRGSCKGPMDTKGYGRDIYYSCVICGHLIYVNPASQAQLEQGRNFHERTQMLQEADVPRN